jgi:hypothetical protein
MNKKYTLLGVGPVSKNCVDATIEISEESKKPLFLIASRNQIDAEFIGGGYVNKWTTEEFSKYVFKKNTNLNKIILARDHGGPWQNETEVKQNMNLDEAMSSAKKSFKVDIESGFGMVHIDTSNNIHEQFNEKNNIDRAIELLIYCTEIIKKNNKNVIIEIGLDKQIDNIDNFELIKNQISEIKKACVIHNLILPTYIVVQTGTKVFETKNTGTFTKNLNLIKEIVKHCESEGFMIKQHNTDYLPNKTLQLVPKVGIHAANVAPEFGVVETIAFVNLLKKYKLNDLLDKFLNISYNSMKWKKWLLPNSQTTDYEKSIIAGHYVFSNPEILDIKNNAQSIIKEIIIDDYLKDEIKKSIRRYLTNFNLIK